MLSDFELYPRWVPLATFSKFKFNGLKMRLSFIQIHRQSQRSAHSVYCLAPVFTVNFSQRARFVRLAMLILLIFLCGGPFEFFMPGQGNCI